jgi:hypothetical protein
MIKESASSCLRMFQKYGAEKTCVGNIRLETEYLRSRNIDFREPNVKDNGLLSLPCYPHELCLQICMAKLWFVIMDASVHPTVIPPMRPL